MLTQHRSPRYSHLLVLLACTVFAGCRPFDVKIEPIRIQMEPEQHSPKISGTRDVFLDFSEVTVEVSGPKGSAFCDEEDAFNKMINKAVRVTYENLVKSLYETPRIIIVRNNEEFDEDAIKSDYTYIRPRRMMADIASQPGGLLVDYKNQSQAALYVGVR